ncbi:MAG: ABC transporter permease [Spirochaetes bacterium]|nr:ABC transporter permease [Spirochaetota bacterium]
MKHWVLLVANRYFLSPRRGSSHVPTFLSVLGIATGVMTLFTVIGVMNGFQHSTIEAILELNSYHIRLSGYPEDLSILDRIRGIPNIRSVFPFSDMETLIQGSFSDPMVCTLRFLPQDILQLDPSLQRILTMIDGEFDLTDPDGILLGVELARYLGVRVGDTVKLLWHAGDFNTLSPQMKPFLVKGIWKSEYYEHDAGWGFLPFKRAYVPSTNGSPVYTGIKLVNRFGDEPVRRAIELVVPPSIKVTSWREYNRAIFGALRMEKTVMMILIGLIFLVVGGNIYRSQQRHISERIEEIGLLRAMGASPTSIQSVFILEGAFIGFLGAGMGGALGLFLSGRINEVFRVTEKVVNTVFHWANLSLRVSLFSPANFYISEVRAIIPLWEAFLIVLFAIGSTTIAAFLASYKVATIYPVEVLRYE